jgi:hypothetical protein
MQPRRDLERMSMALRCWKGFKPNPDGRPAKEKGSCVPVNQQAESPANMTKAQYNKKNAKMRKDHKGKLSKQQKSGKGGSRISFACRFGKNPQKMKAKDGTPSGYAHALKKWGFGSAEAARKFCNANKEKK